MYNLVENYELIMTVLREKDLYVVSGMTLMRTNCSQ